MDICFIIDTSVSVFPDEWYDLREFIADMVSGMTIGPSDMRVGYITYSNVAKVSATLDRYATRDAAIAGAWNDILHLNASTRTNKGLLLASSHCFGGPGDRAAYDNLAILLTDGRSSVSVTDAAATLRGVAKVIGVGVDMAVESQLRDVVGGDDSLWFKVPRFTDLNAEVPTLLAATCGESFVSKPSSKPVSIVVSRVKSVLVKACPC